MAPVEEGTSTKLELVVTLLGSTVILAVACFMAMR